MKTLKTNLHKFLWTSYEWDQKLAKDYELRERPDTRYRITPYGKQLQLRFKENNNDS